MKRTVMTGWLLSAVIAAGCGSGPSNEPGPVEEVPPVQTPKPQHFAFVEAANDTDVRLVPVSVSETALVVDVVAKRPEVRGVAWRLDYDGAALSFTRVEAGRGWRGRTNRLVTARENRPGVLYGVATLRGAGEKLLTGNHSVARLHFEVIAKKATTLSFAPSRSQVVVHGGAPLSGATFGGGALALVDD